MNDKIRELQKQIEEERQRISKCKHVFDKPFYNPETVLEGYGSKMIAQGSDIWYDYEGYHNVQKERWTRKCTVCGYEEHTKQQKPIVVGHEPDFGK